MISYSGSNQLLYTPLTPKNNGAAITMGGVRCTLGETTNAEHKRWVYPFRRATDIFNERGGSFVAYTSYSSNSSSHAYMWEITNGDMVMKWPGAEETFTYYPGIQFDLKWATERSDSSDWQICRIDLNFYEFDTAYNLVARHNRKMEVKGGNYIFRNSFANGGSSDVPTHKMNQLTSTSGDIPITCWSRKSIDSTYSFASISLSMWVGSSGGGRKDHQMLIANLKPLMSTTSPF